jgi:hypothetical protein
MSEQGSSSRFSRSQASLEDIRQRASESYSAMQSYVEHNPLPAALMAFGLGFGLGAWLGAQLVPGALFREPEPTFAERVGRQVLETLRDVLPESVLSRMGA